MWWGRLPPVLRKKKEKSDRMVLEYLRELLSDRFGCAGEDVEMPTLLDDLNLTVDDLGEIALCLGELYGTQIPTAELLSFQTVEDLVGYVEDQL